MKIPMYQLDAFAQQPFSGNPAAVCVLEKPLPDDLMQQIAAENNLSETAFLLPHPGGFTIRWFTPGYEVDLCGHATLASAWVIFNELGFAQERIRFQSKSGELEAFREGDKLGLDFPIRKPLEIGIPDAVWEAFHIQPKAAYQARDLILEFETAEEVQALDPNYAHFRTLGCLLVVPTAVGSDCDFVSRAFDREGLIGEDPVTGSTHSSLAPFWAEKLGKTSLYAKQLSKRGGELWCKLTEKRVFILGYVQPYLKGDIFV